ncbi:MAG: LbtU family siderophore porin [Candidatus Thiodiazotropha sp. (ex Troendleina suluensis)]|nr:LbtU family siderophore porin [Candidatus Thiodiazotropha sp. (ex Troendleina suluensis)]
MFQSDHGYSSGFLSLILAMVVSCGFADEIDDEVHTEIPSDQADSVRIYRTRDEQREAGLQREITPWLTLSGLLEGEVLSARFDPRERHPDIKASESNATLQLGLIADLFALAEAEVIVEYDTDLDKFVADEAIITFEYEPWELSLGKQYTPFGVYFSHFVSGPLLEFGETRSRKTAILTYGPSDEFDLSLALYRGRATALGNDAEEWDWAVGFEAWPTDNFSFGLSYQSDLADADERLLEEEDDRYTDRVSGISGYLLLVSKQFEFSFELVTATDYFRELEKHQNRPMAWNAELAYFFPKSQFELAIRFEESRELADAAKYQYGLAVTRYEGKHASLTLEYLHGQFEAGSFDIELDDDIPIQHVHTVSAKVTIEF